MALTSASTTAGRTLVANLMKFVPGIGSVGGGAINVGVAVAVTTALGAAWQKICVSDATGDVDLSILHERRGRQSVQEPLQASLSLQGPSCPVSGGRLQTVWRGRRTLEPALRNLLTPTGAVAWAGGAGR